MRSLNGVSRKLCHSIPCGVEQISINDMYLMIPIPLRAMEIF